MHRTCRIIRNDPHAIALDSLRNTISPSQDCAEGSTNMRWENAPDLDRMDLEITND
jgi:hypothetical protein